MYVDIKISLNVIKLLNSNDYIVKKKLNQENKMYFADEEAESKYFKFVII